MFATSWRVRFLAGAAIAIFASTGAIAAYASNKPSYTTFSLFPQRSLINCLKPSPSAPDPKVTVTVKRGDLNDRGRIKLSGFKPNLDFDLFTIQRSPQTANSSSISAKKPGPAARPNTSAQSGPYDAEDPAIRGEDARDAGRAEMTGRVRVRGAKGRRSAVGSARVRV